MQIDKLSNHTYLLPEIAKLRFKEFGYLAPEKNLKDFQKGLEISLNENKLPISFVIVDKQEFVGMFALKENDLETHPHLTPWLASVLVHPQKRHRGIGSFLVKEAQKIAKELHFSTLYLYTPNQATWYEKLGWETIEHSTFNNIPITIMQSMF